MSRKRMLPLIGGLTAFLVLLGSGVAYGLWSTQAGTGVFAQSASTGLDAIGTWAAEGLAVGYDEGNGGIVANAGAIEITNDGSREAWYQVVIGVDAESLDAQVPPPTTFLKDLIRTNVYPVDDVEGCLPTVDPGPTETLDAGTRTYLSTDIDDAPAQLTADGGSIVLCVETWFPAEYFETFGGTWIDLTVQTTLMYAATPALLSDPNVQANWFEWSDADPAAAGAQPIVAHQLVRSADLSLLFEYPIGRYLIDNVVNESLLDPGDPGYEPDYDYRGAICVSQQNQGQAFNPENEALGGHRWPSWMRGSIAASLVNSWTEQQYNTAYDTWPNTGGACQDAWHSQWRLVPIGEPEDNQWLILEASNTFDQSRVQRWSYLSETHRIETLMPCNAYTDTTIMWQEYGIAPYPSAPCDEADQIWRIEGRGDGTYRIVANTALTEDDQEICATIGFPLWNPAADDDNVKDLYPEACLSSAESQGFRLQLFGRPMPSVPYHQLGDPMDREFYLAGYPTTCNSTSPTNIEFGWPVSLQYEQEVRFQVRLGEDDADDDSDYDTTASPRAFGWPNNDANYAGAGYTPTMQLDPSEANTSAVKWSGWILNWYATHGNHLAWQAVKIATFQKITSLGDWLRITDPRTIYLVPNNPTNPTRIDILCSQPSFPQSNPFTGGDPIPISYCSGSDGNSLAFGIPMPTNAASIDWAVYLNGQNVSNIPTGALNTNFYAMQSGTVWGTNFASTDANVQSWWNAQGQPSWVDEQVLNIYAKLSGGSWTLYGTGNVDVKTNGSIGQVFCETSAPPADPWDSWTPVSVDYCASGGSYIELGWLKPPDNDPNTAPDGVNAIAESYEWAIYFDGMTEPPAPPNDWANSIVPNGYSFSAKGTNRWGTGFDRNTNGSKIQNWWTALGQPLFIDEVAVHVYAKKSGKPWILYATGTVDVKKSDSSSDAYIYCETSPPADPVPNSPTFTCTNDAWYSWQAANGSLLTNGSPNYRAFGKYRLVLDGVEIGAKTGDGYSYNWGYAPSANQAFFSNHVGAGKILEVQYTLNDGGAWHTFASKSVTIAWSTTSAPGYRITAGC